MIRSLIKSLAAVAFVAVPFVAACDVDADNNDTNPGDVTAECGEICARLDDCAIEGEDDFDATACTAGCESEADDADAFAADVNECHDCIETNFGFDGADTCATDFTVCGNECANVTFQSN